ncbi:MAG: FAD-dependent oxidoreductase [Bacteroidetes bacterium]|nr:FAD-dependent oxidoreductase [Bacteroidota bacterium]
MIRELELAVSPDDIDNRDRIHRQVAGALQVPTSRITSWHIRKRSLDARSRQPVFRLKVSVALDEVVDWNPDFMPVYREVHSAPRVIVIGFGPAGMFAALNLLEQGIRPIVLERGSDVRSRRKDLRAIQQFNTVNPDSNYCFGEGGAGAYSDGKLYTRSDKRGNIRKVLEVLVAHGATPDILVDAHPHIGSNKLPGVVAAIRESILSHGGEIHFNTRVTGLIRKGDRLAGVHTADGGEFTGEAVILATGHSARDIFTLLAELGIAIEAKPYALGVRIEHSQSLIDRVQYKCQTSRHPALPAASYSLVHQVDGRGVYSFCMCPGGIIIPAATSPGEIVVNGMSMSRRDSKFANSGMVVPVDESDWAAAGFTGVFAGLDFQRMVEQACFRAAGGTQQAPGQRVTDFFSGKVSASLPATSYIPGLTSADLNALLPAAISARLKAALKYFDAQMPGYGSGDALLVATESRTSSPIRVPRDPDLLSHPELVNLFPCGEGAGYAGGIVSAALDGERVAVAAGMLVGKGK